MLGIAVTMATPMTTMQMMDVCAIAIPVGVETVALPTSGVMDTTVPTMVQPAT